MNFAFCFRYLNGWAMAAADGAEKKRAEWPPHPDRVFMALAAAWFETGEDPDEGQALRWLEQLAPPGIAAPDADFRASLESFVPVNDVRSKRKIPDTSDLKKLKEAGLSVLPEHRPRQPRRFPVAIPRVSNGCRFPEIRLIWSDSSLGQYRPALERLSIKVTHVGHPASFVQAWVEENTSVSAIWAPAEGTTDYRIRTPYKGRLDDLAQAYNRAEVIEYHNLTQRANVLTGKKKKQAKEEIVSRFGTLAPSSRRPPPGRWQGYRRDKPQRPQESEEHHSVFDSRLVVLRLNGPRISLTAALRLTKALRAVLMKSCAEQPPPEWFSGHKPDGTPTSQPHLAMFPLPFAGNKHADGRIMGLALALPREIVESSPREIGRCLETFLHDPTTGLPREHTLFDGQWFQCRAELETREHCPHTLNAWSWTRPSREWASVTPVVMNRHFKGEKSHEKTVENTKDACEHIGLPRPREVLLHPVSLVEGVPHAREFPRMERKNGGGQIGHKHAVLTFDEPVRGPVLVGAGRFRGYGLCRPIDGGSGHAGA